MAKKCKPSRYARIGFDGESITYGFRCAKHHVTKRYSTPELREERLQEHRRSAKKSAK